MMGMRDHFISLGILASNLIADARSCGTFFGDRTAMDRATYHFLVVS